MPNNSGDKSLLLEVPKAPIVKTGNAYDGSFFPRETNHFHYMEHDEPHATRRKLMLEKYPQIKQLMTPDGYSLNMTLLLVALQVGIIFLIKNLSWGWVLPITYIASGIISHALFVLIHDLTHFTAFRSKFVNNLIAIIANLGQGIPSAVSFGRFHGDHHTFLGRPGWDPDLPTQWEIGFFKGPIKKFIFLTIMPLFYGLRPYFVTPKAPNPMELLNTVTILSWDFFIYYNFGIKGVVYLVLGTLFGLGLNPVSAHIIAEHYEFIKGQDTYSYYGPFNFFNLNLGYHIEHHDFPSIPWTKLPQVRKIAPEFYENLPVHKSYFQVLYKYIFDSNFGAWCRIGRTGNTDDLKLKRL